MTNKDPYQQAYYPPRPTVFTLTMRQSLLWQMVRFVIINIKILSLMSKSHQK